jgi:hypothetical protein
MRDDMDDGMDRRRQLDAKKRKRERECTQKGFKKWAGLN